MVHRSVVGLLRSLRGGRNAASGATATTTRFHLLLVGLFRSSLALDPYLVAMGRNPVNQGHQHTLEPSRHDALARPVRAGRQAAPSFHDRHLP